MQHCTGHLLGWGFPWAVGVLLGHREPPRRPQAGQVVLVAHEEIPEMPLVEVWALGFQRLRAGVSVSQQ